MEPYADEAQTWVAVAAAFEARPLAYVHLSDQLTIGAEKMPDDFAASFRKTYRGTLIAAGGFTRETAEEACGPVNLI